MTYMTFVYVFFVWCIAMIIWTIFAWRREREEQEKEKMTISKGGMRKYFKGGEYRCQK